MSGANNFIKSRGILISGKELDISFLKNKWVIVSLAGVIIALLCFGAIRGYAYYINKKADTLKQSAIDLAGGQSAGAIKDASSIEALDNTVKKLRQNHTLSSNFFVLLEKNTLPEIRWTSISLDAVSGNADMRGKAASYSYLARQITDFKNQKMEITVSGISLDKDGVGFSAKLKFDPALLKIEAK